MSTRGANIMGHGGAEDAQGLAYFASIVISAALVGAALLACMQLLRGLLSSEALRCGAETFRAGSTPLALMSAIFV